MTRDRWAAHLPLRPAVVLVAALVMAGCTAAPGASSTAASGTLSASPTAMVATSPAGTTLEADGSAAVTVRMLGEGPTETYGLLSREIMERGGVGNCLKMVETERGIGEDELKDLLADATGVERLIGESVWLGTLEGAARSQGSVEVVVPAKASRQAWIIARVPAGSFDAPAGSLAAFGIRRLDAPAGASVPPGAELWLFTGDLLASMTCR